jgi:pimeloyl-ACP methyl ester carboxylesterase
MVVTSSISLQTTSGTEIASRKRGCLFYARRGLKWLGIGLVALVALGFIFETIMQAGDAQRYPAPGQRVEVDGYTMHIDCEGSGSPTVILESGAGAFSVQSMAWQEMLSDEARVCVYDRAGMGWSDARPEPRTAWQIVHELHGLLTNANVEPPYVMVGPSNGGVYVRAYAAEYPNDVAGLVLLDPTFERDLAVSQGLPSGMFIFMGRLGFFRVFSQSSCPTCSPERAAILAARRGTPSYWDTYDAEWAMLQSPDEIPVLIERLGQPGALGDTPLVVIAANQSGLSLEEADADYRAALEAEEDAMSALSTNHRYSIVMGDHGLSDYDDLINQSIRDVIASARAGQPLAK